MNLGIFILFIMKYFCMVLGFNDDYVMSMNNNIEGDIFSITNVGSDIDDQSNVQILHVNESDAATGPDGLFAGQQRQDLYMLSSGDSQGSFMQESGADGSTAQSARAHSLADAAAHAAAGPGALTKMLTSAAVNAPPAMTTKMMDQVCLGQAVGSRYKLDEWYDDSCRKYRCEPHGDKYRIKVHSCEKPTPPPTAIECREYQLDGKSVKYPSCCSRLRCIVSYHGKKFIQIVGQRDEILNHDAYKTDYSTESSTPASSTAADPDPDNEETPLQIIKRAEEEYVKTLGFTARREAQQSPEDLQQLAGVSTIGVADQMCVGTERRRRRRYTPLRVWYDDACHKYRCEVLNGKYHIAVFGCMKPEAPVNAIQCNEYNLDNENVMYPICCPRLRCVVVIKGDMYIRISGQPEEEFPDVPLRTNQQNPFNVNFSKPLVGAASELHTSAPVTYYYPKQADAYYSELEPSQRNRQEAPLPMMNVHIDWKHNVLTEFIHKGVIKALQYLKESLHG